MKTGYISACLLTMLVLCSSCIQDEPLNPESDILSFSIPSNIAFSEAMINQSANTITVFVKENADLSQVTATVTTNETSVVSPQSNATVDFTKPVIYTVTAEDKVHTRDYTVTLIPMTKDVFTSLMLKFNFDTWTVSSQNYATPHQVLDLVKFNIFSTSNEGVSLYQQLATPALFPTHPIQRNGGFAAEMVTQKGPGNILNIQYIPVIAGCVFTGTMNLLNALKDPLTATQMGQAFFQKPLRMKGLYNYKAGTGDYIGPDGKVKPGVKDSCAIYAVFYKTDDQVKILDGTNIRSHQNVVSLAMMPNRSSTPGNELVPFDIPFLPVNPIEIDFHKYTYKLALIFSSSFWGDRYEGVYGSKLIIDDVEIETEDK
ncbi:MAG: PCMD domain-containing protein [Tannerellaceae bacterium]